MDKEYDKVSVRLAHIIMKLNNGERFSAKELCDEFNVSVRTVQRDFERLEYLPIENENNCYFLSAHALGKLSYKDIQNFAYLSGIDSLYPSLDSAFLNDILNTKFKKFYSVKSGGFVDIKDKKELFEELSGAIIRNSSVSFTYKDKGRVVNPYRLINTDGVWYLLADENEVLKTFTFSKIKDLLIDYESQFEPKEEFLAQLDESKTKWVSDEFIDVVLEVDNKAKKYFFRKETLSNVKLIEEGENSFRVSAKVSYEDEIINFVKYWIPYVKIISPLYLDEKLKEVLMEYLNR